jgi:hypothetical protein
MQQLLASVPLELYLQNFSFVHQLTSQLVHRIQGIEHAVANVNLKEISN